jgi:hypothetical protein
MFSMEWFRSGSWAPDSSCPGHAWYEGCLGVAAAHVNATWETDSRCPCHPGRPVGSRVCVGVQFALQCEVQPGNQRRGSMTVLTGLRSSGEVEGQAVHPPGPTVTKTTSERRHSAGAGALPQRPRGQGRTVGPGCCHSP